MYLFLELSLGGLFALAYLTLGLSLVLIPFLIALAVLAFIVVYDLRHTLVPPEASCTLALLALLVAFLHSETLSVFGAALIWAGSIALFFFLLHVCSRGRAMGLGDTPVAFALSLLVAPYALAGLLFSFWIGALCGIIILGMRRGRPTMGVEVPFVPFMAAGFLLAYFTTWNPLPF
jgi:leader peptidase (prepilin peptidase) / N-methyltransferase